MCEESMRAAASTCGGTKLDTAPRSPASVEALASGEARGPQVADVGPGGPESTAPRSPASVEALDSGPPGPNFPKTRFASCARRPGLAGSDLIAAAMALGSPDCTGPTSWLGK